MKEDTKNAIYILLDLLDSLKKSSNYSHNLININPNKFEEIKTDLFNLMSKSDFPDETRYNEFTRSKWDENYANKWNEKMDLIGILPYVLMDKNKFPNNEAIVRLAEKSLNMRVLNWNKRSRNEIIGVIISNIAENKEKDFKYFLNPWKKFINNESLQKFKSNVDFVDLWLNFFENYKRGQE